MVSGGPSHLTTADLSLGDLYTSRRTILVCWFNLKIPVWSLNVTIQLLQEWIIYILADLINNPYLFYFAEFLSSTSAAKARLERQ